jgi:hypothetical protein
MASAGEAQPEWRRSSYFDALAGEAVAAQHGHALIRDSSDAVGPVLSFTVGQWRRFARELSRIPSHEGNAMEVASL